MIHLEESLPVRFVPDDRLWSVEDLSAYLGIPVPTLYRWRRCRCGASVSSHRPPSAVPARGSRRLAPRAAVSIQRRGDSWRARYYGPDGRQRSKSFRRLYGHLYPGEMDRYADRLGSAAEEAGKAKIRPDDTGKARTDRDQHADLRGLWRARRDSNPQPSDP